MQRKKFLNLIYLIILLPIVFTRFYPYFVFINKRKIIFLQLSRKEFLKGSPFMYRNPFYIDIYRSETNFSEGVHDMYLSECNEFSSKNNSISEWISKIIFERRREILFRDLGYAWLLNDVISFRNRVVRSNKVIWRIWSRLKQQNAPVEKSLTVSKWSWWSSR